MAIGSGANGRSAPMKLAIISPLPLTLVFNFFDTADVYSAGVSEEITGRLLAEMASRDDVVLATKVNGPMGPGPNRRGLSRKHILEACDNSLRRLKTDFID